MSDYYEAALSMLSWIQINFFLIACKEVYGLGL